MALLTLTDISKTGQETGASVADKINIGFSHTRQNTNLITELTESVGTSLQTIEEDITNNQEAIASAILSQSVFGVVEGQVNPLHSLVTGVSSPIDSYISSGVGNFVIATPSTGFIRPESTGWYKVNLFLGVSFASTSTTRTVEMILENKTTAQIVASCIVNIPKDATKESFTLAAIFNLTAGQDYGISLKPNTSFDLTIDVASFSINKV